MKQLAVYYDCQHIPHKSEERFVRNHKNGKGDTLVEILHAADIPFEVRFLSDVRPSPILVLEEDHQEKRMLHQHSGAPFEILKFAYNEGFLTKEKYINLAKQYTPKAHWSFLKADDTVQAQWKADARASVTEAAKKRLVKGSPMPGIDPDDKHEYTIRLPK